MPEKIMREAPQIFFSAGEPSGDIHAASLITEIKKLNPHIECVGYGGPEMEKAGCKLHFDMTQMAVMWFARVALRYFQFRKLVHDARRYFAQNNVQAVVVVDFPGFNWWIAAAAKKCNIPVYYYMPPQVWAWAQWRVKKMHKSVTTIFTCLPFETTWYSQQGCHVLEIGHPFIEEAKHQIFDADFVENLKQDESPILAILPGSRDQEITSNLKEMLQAVHRIREKHPKIRPIIGAFKESQVDSIQKILKQSQLDNIPILVRKTQELIRAAHSCIAVSGSVSMELMVNAVPTVIYYRLNPFAFQVQRFFRRVKYITLVNMLGLELLTPKSIYLNTWPTTYDYPEEDVNDMIFPEFLTDRNQSQEVCDTICNWLDVPEDHQRCQNQLQLIHAKMQAKENPFHVAAKELLKHFEETPQVPHIVLEEGQPASSSPTLQEEPQPQVSNVPPPHYVDISLLKMQEVEKITDDNRRRLE